MSEFLRSFTAAEACAPLFINLAGITYPTPNYHMTRAKSRIWVIEYVTDGEGTVIINGEEHRIGEDTVYFLSAGEKHEYFANSENPFTKIFMNVTGSLCESLVSAYGLSGKHIFDGNGLKPLFEKIPVLIESDAPDTQINASLQGLFLEILSRLSHAISETKHNEEAIKLKNHLDSNLDRQVSASELARQIFRSQDYCQKLFLREFGVTPYAYQLKRKIEIAKALLRDTELPIGDIAKRVGYNDIHYFSNIFFEKCGTRPSFYRKSKK